MTTKLQNSTIERQISGKTYGLPSVELNSNKKEIENNQRLNLVKVKNATTTLIPESSISKKQQKRSKEVLRQINQDILMLYKDNVSYLGIAEITGENLTNVKRIIAKLIKRGNLESRTKPHLTKAEKIKIIAEQENLKFYSRVENLRNYGASARQIAMITNKHLSDVSMAIRYLKDIEKIKK